MLKPFLRVDLQLDEKILLQRCSLVKFVKFFKKALLKSTCERLRLELSYVKMKHNLNKLETMQFQ